MLKDCLRADIPQFFVDMGYKTGAEIGVYKGDFTQQFLDVGLKVYAIDPWEIYDGYLHHKGQKRQDFVYGHATRALSKYSKCQIMRKKSMDALSDFEDGSLDFVYIDGNHEFRYFADDVYEWEKKVRPGGVVSGHDYIQGMGTNVENTIHCKYVINAYIACYKIKNWYLTDSSYMRRGRRIPDWFWIKEA